MVTGKRRFDPCGPLRSLPEERVDRIRIMNVPSFVTLSVYA
jgi:hypothetical protein